MYMNAAYLKNLLIAPQTPADLENPGIPLQVLCCGEYRVYSVPELCVNRPEGRKDYQLLYFHSGQGHFSFGEDETETVVHAGQMVLFCPHDRQVYRSFANDRAEFYWVHFTGNQAKNFLDRYEISCRGCFFKSGIFTEYKDLFLKMITEIQIGKICCEDRVALYLLELFLTIHRNISENRKPETRMQREMNASVRYFTENYNKEIVVAEYARKHFLSPCWFTRNFKQYTGMTPAQYITSIRISNAQSLLENHDYTINEVAALVGYDDPLYFSRVFKKHVKHSPKEYRNLTTSF